MVYILGRFFENSQTLRKALTSLYGLSCSSPAYLSASKPPHAPTSKPSPAHRSLLARVLAKHYLHPTATLASISPSTLAALTDTLSGLTIENDLRRVVSADIERLRDMGSYRGRRHVLNLPVRGQRTRTQIKTARKLNKVPRNLGLNLG